MKRNTQHMPPRCRPINLSLTSTSRYLIASPIVYFGVERQPFLSNPLLKLILHKFRNHLLRNAYQNRFTQTTNTLHVNNFTFLSSFLIYLICLAKEFITQSLNYANLIYHAIKQCGTLS